MIQVSSPIIFESTKKYVNDCLDSGWISSSGKYISEFEQKWAEYCGMKYGIAVSNGTVALELAMRSLAIPKGSEVILPSFTIISCALAVIRAGFKPVLADCDPETWCIEPDKITDKITDKTKAIMPVHIYGHPCQMDKIMDISKEYSLDIIEDCAESHGAEFDGRKCGSFGSLSCFSFFANKILTCGEGGMILTNDPDDANRLRRMRNLCFGEGRDRFEHYEAGFNFRMTNIQAAIGVSQLENIDYLIAKKRIIAHLYNERLKDVPGIQLPVEKSWAKNTYWMYSIVLEDKIKITVSDLMAKLYEAGIESRPFFLGMHEQPVFKKMSLFKDEHYPVTERISRRGLYLPSGFNLTENEIDFVCEKLKEIIA